MQRVFVLDNNRRSLMPCRPARARHLLAKGKAKVYRRYPFTIILTERAGGETQKTGFKIDPGSKVTGLAVVGHFTQGKKAIWSANLHHRGDKIREALQKRRGIRRSRRSRKTRYRKARFDNRKRKKGWLAPSIRSRIDNVIHWAKKVMSFVPIEQIDVEIVRFDPQKMDNPEISGVEYQRGELAGFEIREYLLEKWGRKCAYCDRQGIPLEIDHVVSRKNGGSNRVSNLTLSCKKCNLKKGSKEIGKFLAKDPPRLAAIQSYLKKPLKDAATVNTSRYAIGEKLKKLGLPVLFYSGGRTKYNRTRQGYAKAHWIDAVCVGKSGEKVYIPPSLKPLIIKAQGRGTRQMCRVDRYGFPRTKAKNKRKRIENFQTGDLVRAVVPTGKKVGTYIGRVSVRSSGYFNISTANGTIQGVSHRFCKLSQRSDGYSYF